MAIIWPAAPDWRSWRHVTKLDPDRPLAPRTLDLIYSSGTEALVVGGSTGMTQAAVSNLLKLLADSPLPVALEVSAAEAAMPGADLFLIPMVLNSRDPHWLVGAHVHALTGLLPEFSTVIPWHLLVPEAYLVLNPESAAAELSQAETGLDAAAAAAYAALAGRVLRLPLLYVEYSGAFGDMGLLRAVKEAAGPAHVVYGGGIQSADQAARAAAIADTVVVGNLVQTDPERLRETVAAVKTVPSAKGPAPAE